MKSISDYKEQHKTLMEQVTVLQTLLTEDQLKVEANAHMVHNLLRNLAEKVRKHLAMEDKELYPSFLADEDPEIKAIAWGFLRNESPLRKSFEQYSKRWLRTLDAEDNKDFISDTREVLDSLRKRIEKEEKELFPRLEKASPGGQTT